MIAPHSVIRWTDSLLLGVEFVDHDHRHAVDAINHLAALAVEGGDLTADAEAFRDHCAEHFAREEAMMTRTAFFGLEPHRDEHQRVLAELDGIILRLKAGEDCRDYFTEALPQWFLEHRATMDFVTADFARERGWTGPG
ncbi:hemerythrin [Paramagnetospirillum marisnigri]|uniref:Hemerythrin n=1 Tax=Paramagnetospirillum marisnigri TaxID=1285242 RepID=A0A178MU17_9PROT|nr:hemerythrin family protein [Paramagnetospirillum marisnigri]OAN52254.1 hemerythrin [Paramagnetospirillum marisnigri]